MRKERGITLVALVITVIVMLILAGVAISALSGQEGLFSKTKDAADTYTREAQVENEKIENLIDKYEYYLNIYALNATK